VIRTGEAFGATYNILVLCGAREQRVLDNGHDQLSTYGLLADVHRTTLKQWFDQLAAQGYLDASGEYQVLKVTPKGRRVLSGAETPRLAKPLEVRDRKAKAAKSADAPGSWDGVDRALFDILRGVRRELADSRGIPAYMVFDDAALRDMARKRPVTRPQFLEVRGVGEKKSHEYADRFIEVIQDYVQDSAAPARRR
jgi:ATP-dependent DNA helicase RecQ